MSLVIDIHVRGVVDDLDEDSTTSLLILSTAPSKGSDSIMTTGTVRESTLRFMICNYPLLSQSPLCQTAT